MSPMVIVKNIVILLEVIIVSDSKIFSDVSRILSRAKRHYSGVIIAFLQPGLEYTIYHAIFRHTKTISPSLSGNTLSAKNKGLEIVRKLCMRRSCLKQEYHNHYYVTHHTGLMLMIFNDFGQTDYIETVDIDLLAHTS